MVLKMSKKYDEDRFIFEISMILLRWDGTDIMSEYMRDRDKREKCNNNTTTYILVQSMLYIHYEYYDVIGGLLSRAII